MFELVLRIGFSLLVVFGLMWALARVIRRPLGGRRAAGPLSVLNRQQLTRGAAITVVQVGAKALILGVTDQQVSLLGETDLAAFEKQPHDPGKRDPVLGTSASLDYPSAEPMPTDLGRLGGSILAPGTWRSTMSFLRDRTTRR